MATDPNDGGPTTESREEKRVEVTTEPTPVQETTVTETTTVEKTTE